MGEKHQDLGFKFFSENAEEKKLFCRILMSSLPCLFLEIQSINQLFLELEHAVTYRHHISSANQDYSKASIISIQKNMGELYKQY